MDGVRISAVDLQDAQRRASRQRAASPEKPVLLDIEVLIDRDTRAAFDAFSTLKARAEAGEGRGLRYVGTPRGLAGLIADVQRLGIADGVVLKPLGDSPVSELMLDELAPGLVPSV
jgi:alkanesulfonate monooxygenase SsuD/methylene tetrahydromethanopterin reductase-like flavin-dependent oxidoreductase (luciferase family)